MTMRLPRLTSWTVAFIAAIAMFASVLLPVPSASAAAANPAEAFVQQSVDRGYAILNNASLSAEQRRTQFRDFMLSLTDTNRIGLFTLGQYATGASPADLTAFENAFTDYASAVYESRLSKYKGQTLRVTGSTERAADDVIVNADIVNPGAPNGTEANKQANAQPIKVAFRVRKTMDGRPIITDMEVEGVWLALSERSDFTGFLQQHGGSIAALTDHLRSQAQQVRAEARNKGGAFAG